jgi:hypothetical protein
LKASELPAGSEGWQTFINLAHEMNNRVNNSSLAPLIKRTAEASDPSAALESAIAYIANRPLRNWSDSDVERFSGQVQLLGHLFLSERNSYLPDIRLTPEEKQKADILISDLRKHLNECEENPHLIQAVLQQLLNLYKSDNSTHQP